MTPRLLWAEQVAERAGVGVRSIRKLTAEAKKRREAGTLRPYDLPEPYDWQVRRVERGTTPDGSALHAVAVRSPRYREADITAWLKSRPGKGRGKHQPKGETS